MKKETATAGSTNKLSKGAVEKHAHAVYHFCARMTLSEDDAAEAFLETWERAFNGNAPSDAAEQELWLLKIADHVIQKRLPPEPEVDFDLLDDTLRSEATRT